MSENDYRTPGERQAQTERENQVRKILNQAVTDAVSYKLAAHYNETPDTVDTWLHKIRDGLQTLTDTQRLTAIMLLLEPRADDEFRAVLDAVALMHDTRDPS